MTAVIASLSPPAAWLLQSQSQSLPYFSSTRRCAAMAKSFWDYVWPESLQFCALHAKSSWHLVDARLILDVVAISQCQHFFLKGDPMFEQRFSLRGFLPFFDEFLCNFRTQQFVQSGFITTQSASSQILGHGVTWGRKRTCWTRRMQNINISAGIGQMVCTVFHLIAFWIFRSSTASGPKHDLNLT